ncbi:ATP-binding protein [Sedimentitalea sp. XS_ASV28]|uniref:hybrid sensor histidine kinase/response regulator n=1 Tax=Sedimentitalea sp. XS_ASV28 TaxID=3241296 RepID=UPI003511EF4E
MATLNEVPAPLHLRANENYRKAFAQAQAFLERTVPLIDGSDEILRASLGKVSEDAWSIRLAMREMTSLGLAQFTEMSELRRRDVAITLFRLAVVVAGLIVALALAVAWLVRLNNQLALRRRAIFQTASRLNTIIATSLDAIIVCDARGCILEFNHAAEVTFDRTVAEVVGRNVLDVTCPPELRSGFLEQFRRYRKGKNPNFVRRGRIELEAMRRNGERFPAEVAVQAAHTDNGHIFIIFVRDISAQVQVESELVDARDRALAGERIKTEFLATMSHEIRTPLNGLLGNLSLLRNTDLAGRQARIVSDMETSGKLLLRHVSDVLDITRYDTGNLRLEHVPTNLDRLVKDLIDSQSGTASGQGTTMSWQWIGEPMHCVSVDPDHLLHILQNLIANAVKFTHAGHVSITAQALHYDDGAHEIMFRVRDTGIGIAADLRETVFDDFVTGDAAYDRQFGGTGLGLSIARRFATAMGGDIGLDETDGTGASFWVRIPVEPCDPMAEAASQDVTDATVKAAPSLSILVVEDNEINRVVVCEMLESAGHHVTMAHDGSAGVMLAARTRFDLILMDISMPVMDGRAATRAIRSGRGASADAPIIAFTANALAEEQAAFLQDGMNGILTKPLSQEALAEIIDKFTAFRGETPSAPVDIDHRQQTLMAFGPDGYGRLLGKFIVETEDLIDDLSRRDGPGDAEIARRCHQVAGSAAVFGATAMRDSLRTIEIALEADDSGTVAAQLACIVQIWEETKTSLQP